MDDAAQAVTGAAPWVGLLWITALPARLSFTLLVFRLVQLGETAQRSGDLLGRLAFLTLCTWLLSLWGRQVFVRACRHALVSERPLGRAGLQIPPRELAAHLLAALELELLFWALFLTVLVPLALLPLAGLAAVAAPRARPGFWQPLRETLVSTGSLFLLLRLIFVFAIALPLAAANLHALVQALLWLAGGLAFTGTSGWRVALSVSNPLYLLLLGCGATLLVEPFWLAALTSHVERVRARSSGDDLRQWFAAIRARS